MCTIEIQTYHNSQLIIIKVFLLKIINKKYLLNKALYRMKEKLIFSSVAILIQILKLFKNRAKLISKSNLLNIVR